MAFITITAPGDIAGTLSAAFNAVAALADAAKAIAQDQTDEGKALKRILIEAVAIPLAIVTKINGGLHIDPLQEPAADPPK